MTLNLRTGVNASHAYGVHRCVYGVHMVCIGAPSEISWQRCVYITCICHMHMPKAEPSEMKYPQSVYIIWCVCVCVCLCVRV